LRRQHHRARFRIVVDIGQRIRDLVDQRNVEEIQRRPLDLDGGDVAGLLDADVCKLRPGGPRLK